MARRLARRGLLVLCFALLGGVAAQAATEVSGALSADVVWTSAQSPYLVTADLSIEGGARLRIEPGVTVYMAAGTSFTVNHGGLRAIAGSGQPIVFTSAGEQGGAAARGDWGQLRFLDNTLDAETVLDGVSIRYGKGISIAGASPTLNRVSILNNAGAAIGIDLNASPLGTGLVAEGNDINAILVPAGEIGGAVQWRLQGIPYLLASGELSIGKRPTVAAISPASVQQGMAVDAVISGSRLGGAERVVFDAPGVVGILSGAGSDTAVPVRITASAAQPLGNVGFSVQTAAGLARSDAGIAVIAVKPAIVVGELTPPNLRREESKTFVLSGNYLNGAAISVPAGVGLSLGNLQTTATQATFTLSASTGAMLGAQTLTVSNPAVANGTGTATVTIERAFPKILVSPSPLVVPPGETPHAFTVRLTDSDSVAHTLNLSVVDASIASLPTASVTIPAGATQATVSMVGLKLGYTVLNVASPTLAAVSVPVYVTDALANGASVGPLLSPPVGVDRKTNAVSLPPGALLGPTLSDPVGVSRATNIVTLPPGASLGPALSSPVGVYRAADLTTLPAGSSLGPVTSSPVGVDRQADLTTMPTGFSVGPVLSLPVGMERQLPSP